MRRRFSELPRLTRLAVVVAVLIAVLYGISFAHDVVWRREHPAPLGRTRAHVERELSARLPNGTSLDSAVSYLAHNGLEHSVTRDRESDSLYSGGPVNSSVERDVASSLIVSKSIHVMLYFDSSHKLVRREVENWLTGP
jgi:hypothetical protein